MPALPPDQLATCRRLAEEAALAAAEVALRRYRDRDFSVESKGTQDFVSAVDRDCEAIIAERLRPATPDFGFVGEEGDRLAADVAWVVDPIDGTSNYIHGLAYWCVSIGLYAHGRSVVGVIVDPVAGEIFSAAEGLGATVNGRPMRVSGAAEPAEATLAVGYSYRKPIGLHLDTLRRVLERGCVYRMPGAGALALAHVAAGRFDGFWESHINAWDAMAGVCLVEEAGGWVNGFLSGDCLAKGNEILAATPGLAGFFREATGGAG
ncbi:inositol monophosphatase family protein [Prosthecomicrobium sp. N25]|uniref:inositol monophosphatase family protein n=1 Tax=Prosthecomicrobium sp. N25 TaxID=3129254 RepID=UPI003076EB62